MDAPGDEYCTKCPHLRAIVDRHEEVSIGQAVAISAARMLDSGKLEICHEKLNPGVLALRMFHSVLDESG